MTQRGLAPHGRMNRSPKKASVRAPSPLPRTMTAWWPAEWPPVGTTVTPGRSSCSPSTQPSRAPVLDERSARAGRTRPRAAGCRRGRPPTPPAGRRSSRAGRRACRRDRSRPPAWSKWRWLIATTLTLSGRKPAASSAGTIGRALVGTHRPGLVVDPLADPGLDEDTPARRLDEQAVEGLEESMVVVDLVGDEAVPQDPRDRPEQGPGIGPERARLDERDRGAATEVGRASRPRR